jgi:hypothetical protein
MFEVNYVGSTGTTTLSPNNTAPSNPWAMQGSTGLFWWYRSYGIQSVTDGTSNTVAFSEAPVSNNGGANNLASTAYSLYPGNSMTGIAGAGGAAQQYDANQNPAAVIAGLQACTAAWNAHQGFNNCRGIFWEVGSLGMTMFHTIATPNSKQYNWGDCRFTGGATPTMPRSPTPIVCILAASTYGWLTAVSGSSRTRSTRPRGGRWGPAATAK